MVIAVSYRVVTKQTTAEIIYDRDDAERPHMGGRITHEQAEEKGFNGVQEVQSYTR